MLLTAVQICVLHILSFIVFTVIPQNVLMNKCLCANLVLLRFEAATVAFNSFHFYLNL